MGSTVFRILQTLQNPQASPLGFYISVFSILNPVDPLASVSNLYIVVRNYWWYAYQYRYYTKPLNSSQISKYNIIRYTKSPLKRRHHTNLDNFSYLKGVRNREVPTLINSIFSLTLTTINFGQKKIMFESHT